MVITSKGITINQKSKGKGSTSGRTTNTKANSKRIPWMASPKYTSKTRNTTMAELDLEREMAKASITTKMEITSLASGSMIKKTMENITFITVMSSKAGSNLIKSAMVPCFIQILKVMKESFKMD